MDPIRESATVAVVVALAAGLTAGALAPAAAVPGPDRRASPAGGRHDGATLGSHGSRRAAPRPNVVLVLADDLGWSDSAPSRANRRTGSDFNQTPALTRLASQGTSFDNAYASSNCAPTRAALLTGAYPQRPQNQIYAVSGLNRGGSDTLLVGPEQGTGGDEVLPASAVTVAEAVRRAGYATGYAGKFHVTENAAQVTRVHGFDENRGGGRAGNPVRYHAKNGTFDRRVEPSLDAYAHRYTQRYVDTQIKPFSRGVPKRRLDALVGTRKHLTDAVADATLDFIRRKRSRPFLAVMASYAVHSPVGPKQARRDLLAKYRAKRPGSSPSRPAYAALVEGLDQTVARLTRTLRTTPDPRNPGHPLADNTVVIFTSDNGGRTDLGAYNGPLKGQKSELSEGGVRVPWIAWSGNRRLVRPGRVNHSVINSTDFYATVLQLAGAEPPRGVTLDGTSLTRAFARGARITRPRFAHLPGYMRGVTRDQRPQSYVRDGRWKLVYSYENQRWALYDLAADRRERHDVAARRPDVVRRLATLLVRWLDATDAPLATLRRGRSPIRLTVDGLTYADGRVQRHDGDTITVAPGDELPLVLPG